MEQIFTKIGYTEEERRRPMIGIVSSYNEIVPGHMNLDKNMSGQHRTARTENGWNIQTGCCHQQARNVLITGKK